MKIVSFRLLLSLLEVDRADTAIDWSFRRMDWMDARRQTDFLELLLKIEFHGKGVLYKVLWTQEDKLSF